MKSEHLPLLNSVSAPAVHPDGSRAVVSVIRPDFDADAYVGQLWTVPLGGEATDQYPMDPDRRPRRLTRGFRDTAPDFSPDGQVLGFLRAAAGGKPQLHVVEAAGGEPQPITAAPLGVSSFAWSPDSRSIVFSARVPEEGRYGSIDGVAAGGEDARLITDFQYRMNGLGYIADKPLQLFLVEVPPLDAEPRVAPTGRALMALGGAPAPAESAAGLLPAAKQLTTGATDHNGASFSADGGTVYFTAALHEEHDSDLVSGIYSIPTAGGAAAGGRAGQYRTADRQRRAPVRRRAVAVLPGSGSGRLRPGLRCAQYRPVCHAGHRRRRHGAERRRDPGPVRRQPDRAARCGWRPGAEQCAGNRGTPRIRRGRRPFTSTWRGAGW